MFFLALCYCFNNTIVLFLLSQTDNNGILERKLYYTKFGLIFISKLFILFYVTIKKVKELSNYIKWRHHLVKPWLFWQTLKEVWIKPVYLHKQSSGSLFKQTLANMKSHSLSGICVDGSINILIGLNYSRNSFPVSGLIPFPSARPTGWSPSLFFWKCYL